MSSTSDQTTVFHTVFPPLTMCLPFVTSRLCQSPASPSGPLQHASFLQVGVPLTSRAVLWKLTIRRVPDHDERQSDAKSDKKLAVRLLADYWDGDGVRHSASYVDANGETRETGAIIELPASEARHLVKSAAADRVHETCAMALDLARPITIEEWLVLEVVHAALGGELGLLDGVIAKVEAEIASRALRH